MDHVVHELHALESDTTQTARVQELLLQLHDLTKRATNASPTLKDSNLAVSTLGHWAFDRLHLVGHGISTSALRCLHNILYLVPSTRQAFVDAQCPKRAMALITHSDADTDTDTAAIAMLTLRRLGDTTFDYTQCLEDHSLVAAVHQNIAREADASNPPSSSPASVLNASLLFLTTITTRCKQSSYRHLFLPLHGPMLQLAKAPILSPPLQLPLSLLMHAIGVTISDGNTRQSDIQLIAKSHVDKVTTALFRTIQTQKKDDQGFETTILPPVELLYSLAHVCDSDMRQHLTLQLLPSDQDRLLVLGQGHTLPHRLIKVATQASRLELEVLMAKLFLELSVNDPDLLVKNVGYGCASGLLFVVDQEGVTTLSTQAPDGKSVNPVTGQMRDAEIEPEGQKWTDEEKQREAERLFVMFERLKTIGVAVENPVHQAAAKGRFTETEEEDQV